MSNLFTVKSRLCVFLLAFLSYTAFGQNIFSDILPETITQKGTRFANPSKFKALKLDASALQHSLKAAPLRSLSAVDQAGVQIAIPMPDGTSKRFTVYETPVMHPDLQARYPEIRCYTGYGLDDRTATLKCDWTPKGFHAMIFSGEHNSVAIEPYQLNDTEHYLVFFKKDYQRFQGTPQFSCSEDEEFSIKLDASKSKASEGEFFAADCKTRKYRLALSSTGEYSAFHGGTKTLVLAAMNTSMNRVNGVYERELSITMEIIPNNDQLIYLNASTDPFTNGNGGTMLGQNQSTVTSVIGSANYDIGHVFSTGGGGIAGLGVVCSNSGKARGVTGQGQPIGDFFDIDYVAHEMGHQFGGNHTFYNSCGGNKNASTAFEPGSGATIMAYAGICSPNVQNNSDDYFHAISLQEIGNFVVSGGGGSCPVTTTTMNNAPTVASLADRSIPISTPFALTAVANDLDNDALTYCWEQMDGTGSATQPPVGANTMGPMFRSIDPLSSPTRYFPSLTNVINATSNTWEVLPTASRPLNFRVTVRDNHQGNGCTTETNVRLTSTASAGPFVVTEPNTNVVWYIGEIKNVTWDVANTDIAPVNCSAVRITLSTDGGQTYPFVLADNEPNDGTAMVNVPGGAISTTARVRIEAKDNYFYDISNTNFRIEEPPVPTFILSVGTTNVAVCAGQSADFNLNFQSLLSFSDQVQLSVDGLPMGATGTFSANPTAPMGASTLNVSGLTAAMAGSYTLTFTATSGSIVRTGTSTLDVLPGVPNTAPTNTQPTQNALGISSQPTLTWDATPYASSYLVEIATNPSFAPGSIVATTTSSNTSFQAPALGSGMVYYWRVQSSNLCGTSPWTSIFAFQTGAMDCGNIYSSNNTVLIPEATAGIVTDVISITDMGTVESLSLNVNIDHSWVGDLDVTLTSPSGTVVQLFDQVGVPASEFGCSTDDIDLDFADDATGTAAQLENLCGGISPALSGEFQPIDLLSNFTGGTLTGNWTLSITDHVGEDGGSLNSWSLDICKPSSVGTAAILTNDQLTVGANQSGTIDATYLVAQLSGTGGQVQFLITQLPASGIVTINGMVATVGSTFSQADVDAGTVVYTHGGNTATTDNFLFNLFDTNNNAWLPSQSFAINILQNTLSAQLSATASILCANGSTGEITVMASGGTPPFSYSLNTTNSFQNSNIFNGLSAGTYSVVVKDNVGFTSTTNAVVLGNPTVLQLSTSVNADVITASGSGGTGALQYSLNGGAYQSSPVFEGLANGSYMISVQDANGCIKETTAIVAVNSLVVSLTKVSGISCANVADASIEVNAGGGQGPYMYSLNGAAVVSSSVFTNLGAGTYSVLVMDSQGFSSTTNSITITAPAAIASSAAVALNVVTITASGGMGVLQYSIDNTTYVNNPVFSGLTNGTYTFYVRDANSCTVTVMATVNIPTLSSSAAQTSEILCAGNATGQVTVAATGGIPPYQYQIGNAAFQMSPVFGGLTTGTYSFTVRDAQGALFSSMQTLTEPSALVLGQSVLGNNVTITAQGGVAPYSYMMTGGAAQNTGVFLDLANGSPSFIVTDANGCMQTISATVNLTAVSGTAQSSQPSCNGSADGSVNISASGGLAPYMYQLGGGAFQASPIFSGLNAGTYAVNIQDAADQITTINFTIADPALMILSGNVTGTVVLATVINGQAPYVYQLDNGMSQSNPVFNDIQPGTYTLMVTDANGCTQSTSVTVDLTAISGTAQTTPPSCNGSADGSVSVLATGGLLPYMYQLGAGAAQASNTFSGLAAGSYMVTIMDAANQTSMVSFTITDPALMIVSAQASNTSVIAAVANGQAPFMYQLDNGTAQSSATFTNVSVGSHTIMVTDANGCTATTSVLVLENTMNITVPDIFPSLCGTNNGLATVCINGGTAPYAVSVSPNNFAALVGANGACDSVLTIEGISAQVYNVTVVDANGFSSLTNFTGTALPALVATALGANAQIVVTATGGTGMGTYSYSIDGGVTQQQNSLFTNVPPGIYTVLVTDANGCTVETTVEVTSTTVEPSAFWGISIAPNPSTGLFAINLDGGINRILTVRVVNITGQVLHNFEVSTSPITQQRLVDLTSFADGVYFLQFTDGQHLGALRLVKMQ